ncbi:MAG: helix-turn-helix transcriptional regulator [Bacteroidetes bacterium]|nr:helix-turn-helix transcriptional regulator [Bacteroidota bacterium]MBU1372751.1 helix-turn-helix transcriptional regulator [Bacteroidota bacterium]MBU1484947.1 helix-turn-helix transcriptional regulator [Bacteroidota bacterium]MBU1762243.1 helix-turn-helix transcriptional regulator [Bacteroidota bacterium]MBU2267116.1 helix-turn-helix transcriptional regulator [Bacteroidota bacterium]
MDIREKIGLRIKELRKGLSLTQEVLAFKANLDKTYVNEVENGKRNISVINLEKIVLALEISVKEFFNHDIFSKGVEK